MAGGEDFRWRPRGWVRGESLGWLGPVRDTLVMQRRGRTKWMLMLALCVASYFSAVKGVPQTEQQRLARQDAEESSKAGRPLPESSPADDDLEPGEVKFSFPKSLNDFYKGRWTLANATGAPMFRHSSGDIVFQIVTRAHGREMKQMRLPRTKHAPQKEAQQTGSGTHADVVLGDGILGEKTISVSTDGEPEMGGHEDAFESDLTGSAEQTEQAEHQETDTHTDKGAASPTIARKPRGPDSEHETSAPLLNRTAAGEGEGGKSGEDGASAASSDHIIGVDRHGLDGSPLDPVKSPVGVRGVAKRPLRAVRGGDGSALRTGRRGSQSPLPGVLGLPALIDGAKLSQAARDSKRLQQRLQQQAQGQGLTEGGGGGGGDADAQHGAEAGVHGGLEEEEEGDKSEPDEGDKAEEAGMKIGKIVVEEVDMVQVDMVIRDGSYSTPRDLHTYMQGLYRKSSGRLQLWTVCSSPECGMYMIGGLKDGMASAMSASGGLGRIGVNKTGRIDDDLIPMGMIGRERAPGAGTAKPFVSAQAGANGGTRLSHENCIFFMDLQVVYPSADEAGGSEEAGEHEVAGEEMELGMGGMNLLERVSLSGNITSENCGVSLYVNASAMNFEVYYTKAMHYTLMVTAASFVQVLLLVRQIDYSNSRSSAVKVSLLTIGQQAVMDSYLCLMHLTTGIVVEALFNAFATAAFFKFMIFSIFEMRYLLIIWKARRPQGFQEGWNSMRRELSMLYSRFYGCLLAGIVFIYQMQKYSTIVMLGTYSFWVPQIIHNIHHDHRKPLLVRYIIGMSATRLLIPLYALACPHNFLHSEPNYSLAALLVLWVAFQVAVLLIQHYKGPRFCIPRRFRPDKYDYYRRVPMVSTSGENEDCAICMMPVGANTDSSPRVVTPCDHSFHQDCLKRWMEIKMECPVCRRVVPDIDED